MENQTRILVSLSSARADLFSEKLDALEDALSEFGRVRIQSQDLYIRSYVWKMVIEVMVTTGGVLSFLDYADRIIRRVWADSQSKVNEAIKELKTGRPGGNIHFKFPVTAIATISLPYLESRILEPEVVTWLVEKMPAFVERKFPSARELMVVVKDGLVDLLVYENSKPSFEVSLPSEEIKVVRELTEEEIFQTLVEQSEQFHKEVDELNRWGESRENRIDDSQEQ